MILNLKFLGVFTNTLLQQQTTRMRLLEEHFLKINLIGIVIFAKTAQTKF